MSTQQAAAPAASEAKPAEEKQTNCLGCGKPLKKIKRYYRNAKFYCNKKCWYKFVNKPKEENK
jgi:predicted transcriptional regulator